MNIEEALEFTDQGRVQTAVDDVRPDALFQMMEDLGEEIPDIRYQGPLCDLKVGSGDRGDDWIVEHYSDEQACACVFGLFTLTFGEWLGIEGKAPDQRHLHRRLHRVNDFDLAVLAHRINEVFDVLPSVDQLARLITINEGEQQNEPGKTGRAAAMSEFGDLVTGKLKGGA
jgi:hypothetical protein